MKLLDAACHVLKAKGVPMTSREMIEPILDNGLWQTTGASPWATLASAIYVDIKTNGAASRFVKAGKGLFALAGSDGVQSQKPSSLGKSAGDASSAENKPTKGKNRSKPIKPNARAKYGPGYVYIMTNSSFRKNWIKIGYTRDEDETVEQRRRELSGSSVPFPFEVFATLKCDDAYHVEQRIHAMIDSSNPKARLNEAREFYDMPPENGFSFLSQVAELLVIKDKITRYKNNKPVFKEGKKVGEDAKRRPSSKFTMLGIGVGEKLVFAPTGVKVTVVNDKRIEYEGKLYSLTKFCKVFMPEEQRCQSNNYQGPKYFTYKGKCLTELR